MGVINKFLGVSGAAAEIGAAVGDVAEVFVPNATREMALEHQAMSEALAQFGVEFQIPREGFFDRFVNGINRLPRPALAMGTLGLFVYAMVYPQAFSMRMQGLAFVPEPLWWLLGAVVSFYFGAREMHHFRSKPAVAKRAATTKGDGNAALDEWRQKLGKRRR